MVNLVRTPALVLLVALLTSSIRGQRDKSKHHKLLLLAFDGIKWSYRDFLKEMPGFKYFEDNGVKAKYFKPTFPTLTASLFTSIATGLHTESHGVIHNYYHDLKANKTVYYGYVETLDVNEWWDNGKEPIWITASSQGLKSGGIRYPGITNTYNGRTATKAIKDNGETGDEDSWKRDIDEVIKWFAGDDFDFATLYFYQPDVASHYHGPESNYIFNTSLPMVGRAVDYIIQRAKAKGLSDDLNIILLSDHGMIPVDMDVEKRDPICYMQHLKEEWLQFQYTCGPFAMIQPYPQHRKKVYDILKGISNNMYVYYKEEIPERFHYTNNDRIADIVLLAKSGHVIYSYSVDRSVKGDHGYDNDLQDMKSIYYAVGPSFKSGITVEEVESVNVYPLMCYLLGIEPAPNNGSLDALLHTLKREERSFSSTIILLFATIFSLILIVNYLY